METTFFALLAVFVVSLVSLIGVAALALNATRLGSIVRILVALAAGALLADAFVHLIPESLEVIGDGFLFGVAALAGVSSFFILERYLRWHHAHHGPETEHSGHEKFESGPSHAHVAPLVLVADGIHNMIDGAVIAASFLLSPSLGVATTVAVFLHEIPQEIADYALLIHAGYSRRAALLWNFLSGITALLGAGFVLYIGSDVPLFAAYAGAVTAGAFIYLAAADLIPELHKSEGVASSITAVFAFLVGVGIMLSLTLLESH